MSGEHDAPGLRRLKRKGGRIDCYWVADKEAVKKGFIPKTQRLFGDPTDPVDFLAMADTCQRLQAEMRQWLDGIKSSGNRSALGTVAWFCDAFETDEDSPFRQKRKATQVFYSRYCKELKGSIGEEQFKSITGRDVRRWHKEWVKELGDRGAYGCIQTLRRVVSYGCELRDKEAIELAEVLSHMEFPPPKPRKKRPTYDLISALRKAAHEAGRPSIALAVTLQFDLGLRQKDVIGEWVYPDPEQREQIEGAITDGPRIWQWGLTWNHIDGSLILKKPTSKSNGTQVAEHDLKQYPDVVEELSKIPTSHRIGPVVLDEHTGKPWSVSNFSRKFRKIANAAGWPKDVWNMDSRAGAVSEAFEAGAEPADVMKTATHTQLSTTMIYNRGAVVQSSRVAELRMAKRRKKDTGEA
ncbi:integrase [Microvirga sp. P5_D2]